MKTKLTRFKTSFFSLPWTKWNDKDIGLTLRWKEWKFIVFKKSWRRNFWYYTCLFISFVSRLNSFIKKEDYVKFRVFINNFINHLFRRTQSRLFKTWSFVSLWRLSQKIINKCFFNHLFYFWNLSIRQISDLFIHSSFIYCPDLFNDHPIFLPYHFYFNPCWIIF